MRSLLCPACRCFACWPSSSSSAAPGARRTGRALTALGAVLLGLGGCGATSALIDHAQRSLAGDHTDRAELVAVIDADTIAVEIKGSEHRVRLLGTDAPESSRIRYGKPSCGAKQAGAFLVHLLFVRKRQSST